MAISEDEAKVVVQILTSQPSQEDLHNILTGFEPVAHFPSASTAAVVFALVNTTIPELWKSLQSSSATAQLILRCLASIAGVNALIMRTDQLHRQIRDLSSSRNEKAQLVDAVQVVSLILENERFSSVSVFEFGKANGSQGKLLMNEYISLVGGSKILNVMSKVSMDLEEKSWAADGRQYSKWLGRQCAEAIIALPSMVEVSTLVGKALTIGYPSLVSCRQG